VFTSTALVARQGSEAPGVTGSTFDFFDIPSLNDAGIVAFRATFSGEGVEIGSNSQGIFTSLGLLVRQGDTVTDPTVTNATFSSLGNTVSLNSGGEVAFSAGLTINGTQSLNNRFIFASSALVVGLGGDAPGTVGASFNSFGAPTMNTSGVVAFRADLTGPDTTADNSQGIFTPSTLVARRGDEAPGTAGAFFGVFGDPLLNDNGEIVFVAGLTGVGVTDANNRGIFTSTALVARKGDIAPGPGNATFIDFGGYSVNNLGEVVFVASFNDGDATATSVSGLFLADSFGNLHNVLRQGDSFGVGANDMRTISRIDLAREGLSAKAVAFKLDFTDGTSGIFTATIDRGQVGVIPLPASVWLLLAGLGTLGVAARRRRAAA